MSGRYVIFASDQQWAAAHVQEGQARFVRVQSAESISVTCGEIKHQLQLLGYDDQPVLLALPSSWCLCATIQTEGIKRGDRHRAGAFRLEEHLPISAEEIIADFTDISRDQSLGVCCELEPLKKIVDAFCSLDIQIQHICPAALLAASLLSRVHPEAEMVLIGTQTRMPQGDLSVQYDLIEINNERIRSWSWLAEDRAAAADRLMASSGEIESPHTLAMMGLDASLIAERPGIHRVMVDDTTTDQAAAMEAARILEHSDSPWIDFRRGPLAVPDSIRIYRKPLIAFTVAAIGLFVCILLVTQWRGRQYQALAARYSQDQLQVFRTAMPGQSVPGSIKGRLMSEQRRLSALGGLARGDAPAESAASNSALKLLHEVLNRFPADIPVRIDDLNIQPDLIMLDGQVQSHLDAEKIASSLRQSGGYDVDPPKTESLKDRGVSFMFSARPTTGVAASKGGGR